MKASVSSVWPRLERALPPELRECARVTWARNGETVMELFDTVEGEFRALDIAQQHECLSLMITALVKTGAGVEAAMAYGKRPKSNTEMEFIRHIRKEKDDGEPAGAH